MSQPFSIDQMKDFDIKSYALNKEKLASLTFDKSYERLENLRQLFLDLIDLDFQNNLSNDESTQINNSMTNFYNLLRRLEQFSIELPNAKQVHDSFEVDVENNYNDITKKLRTPLVFLRQEAARKSQDVRSLADEQKAAMAAKKQYEDLHKEMQTELLSLREQKKNVETAHGDVATNYLAKQFANQVIEYENDAKKWLGRRDWFFRIILIILVANFIAYFLLYSLTTFWKIGVAPREIFTLEYGIIKMSLLAVLSYAVGFASKNYKVNSHLAAVNKHRKNVAQTLEDFLATKSDRMSEMLAKGTDAMFKHISVGYLKREEQKDNGPIYEIINKFLPNKE